MTEGPVTLRGVRVFDNDRLTEPRTVVVAHGVIATSAGGPSTEVLAAVVAAAAEHGLDTVVGAATVGAYAAAVAAGHHHPHVEYPADVLAAVTPFPQHALDRGAAHEHRPVPRSRSNPCHPGGRDATH